MTTQRFAVGITAVNLVLLALLLAPERPTAAQATAPLVRARQLELVDDQGRVRSSLRVEADGEVVLRLLDERGTIRVKLGAGEHGSGLVLMDEATEPAIHAVARRTGTGARPTTTRLVLRGADGRERMIAP